MLKILEGDNDEKRKDKNDWWRISRLVFWNFKRKSL
jgi:hypothetical protein